MEIFRDVIPAAMRQYGTDSAKRMYFIDYPIDEPNDINFCVAVPDGSKGPMCRTGRRRRLCASSSRGL